MTGDTGGTAGTSGAEGRRRPPPETAKDILGQLDTALERVARARNVATAAGFRQTADQLAAVERGVGETRTRVEDALRADLAAVLRRGAERRGGEGMKGREDA